jgi:hypothetical protein
MWFDLFENLCYLASLKICVTAHLEITKKFTHRFVWFEAPNHTCDERPQTTHVTDFTSRCWGYPKNSDDYPNTSESS